MMYSTVCSTAVTPEIVLALNWNLSDTENLVQNIWHKVVKCHCTLTQLKCDNTVEFENQQHTIVI